MSIEVKTHKDCYSQLSNIGDATGIVCDGQCISGRVCPFDIPEKIEDANGKYLNGIPFTNVSGVQFYPIFWGPDGKLERVCTNGNTVVWTEYNGSKEPSTEVILDPGAIEWGKGGGY